MDASTQKRLNLTLNVLIVTVAIVIIGIFAYRHFSVPTPPLPKAPAVGDQVSITDIDWSKSNRNVLLVLQARCQYCTESAGFYRELIQKSRDKDVRVIAVLPQNRNEAEQYLQGLNISTNEIRQSTLAALNVGGTPTIIIADNHGRVTNVWLGKLSPEREKEVLARLE